MDVTIQERRFSLWTEYDITTPTQTLYAKKQMFSLLAKVELKGQDGEVLASLQGQFSVLRNRYEFDLTDGRVCHFECVDRLRSVYECQCGEEVLTLYEHRGLNRSVFQGDRQIAAYAKNRVSIGQGNRYDIRMDAAADLTLVVCMVLALSVAEDNDEKQAVNFDIGNLGPQGKAVDEAWEPKG
jgi:uncharacterized protein YxjI